MSYHPIMGILIFLLAVIISFAFGRSYIKKKSKLTMIRPKGKNIAWRNHFT